MAAADRGAAGGGTGTRWWGWGDETRGFDLDSHPGTLPYLRDQLKLRSEDADSVVALEQVGLPPSAAGEAEQAELDACGGTVAVDHESRVRHALGKSYPDVLRLRRGTLDDAPDAVVYPRDEEGLVRLLGRADRHDWALIPYGGGSSVVGGLEVRRQGRPLAVSVDLRHFAGVVGIDARSGTARIRCGSFGPDLERELNAAGFSLGHFPQSFEHSTLGGWIAARSAGQASTAYGKIEHLVRGLRTVTPAGVWELRDVPASAAGPDLRQMLIGSEGTLGVFTESVVRIHALPATHDYRGYLVRSFLEGLDIVRRLVQEGPPPAVLRVSDEAETETAFALRGQKPGWRGAAEAWVLDRFRRRPGFARPTLLLVGYEGSERRVRRESAAARDLCRRAGAIHLGRGPGEQWRRDRYAHPYLRDVLMDLGVMVETLETAATWTRLESLQAAVRTALTQALERDGAPVLVLCHLSHAYPDGANLYFTFMTRRRPDAEMEQWRAAKRAACETILAEGATLSHHHGIGVDHAAWLPREVGPLGIESVAAMKSRLDPHGVMNPGKLGLDPRAAGGA